MIRYEYTYAIEPSMFKLTREANRLGKSGWEMVGFAMDNPSGVSEDSYVATFKRVENA